MKNFEYAGFWRRQAALLLDMVIIGFPLMIITSLILVPAIYGAEIFQKYENKDTGFFIEFFKKAIYLELSLMGVIAAVMAAFTVSGWQATPGKRILGLKVIKSNGDKVEFGEAFLRYASLPLATLTLRTPERYLVYEKLEKIKTITATSAEEFAQIISTPISGLTEIGIILLSVYWLVRISFSREGTALHDLLFDTRVVKLQR